jgi:hypothetical protein
MDGGLGYLAFNLTEDAIERLRRKFPPRYERFVCHHVTIVFGVHAPAQLPPVSSAIAVVGHLDDGLGLEALIVEVDGSRQRPDGGAFHITHSLAPGRRSAESNEAIRSHGWTALAEPIPIAATPRWNKI